MSFLGGRLIAEWNAIDAPGRPEGKIGIHDETLRDGLQSPSVIQPALDGKIELLHLMASIGVDSVDLGMPVSSRTASDHVSCLAGEIATARLPLRAACAARTVREDIAAVAAIAQRTGLPMSVMAFVGTSPIRMLAEGWSVMSIVHDVRDAVAFAHKEGLGVCLVTEDTTRTRQETAVDVYAAALDAGAERICVCDTVGYATPWGAAACLAGLRRGLAARGFHHVGIDWHGHNDRGLAVVNSITALHAGADRVHATALGIGERAGNTSMEQLLANLCDLGWRQGALTALPRYCELTERICSAQVPGNQPIVGADVYRTATGVHASAIKKAERAGGTWLAERVYAGIPASMVGREQAIEIGPGSGRANVLTWLKTHGIAEDPFIVQGVMQAVAHARRIFTRQELLEITARLADTRPAPVPVSAVPASGGPAVARGARVAVPV